MGIRTIRTTIFLAMVLGIFCLGTASAAAMENETNFIASVERLMTATATTTTAIATNPIEDNNMAAYVWTSDSEVGWENKANKVAEIWEEQGFTVIYHIKPSPELVYETLKDKNVKMYYASAHGSDLASYANGGIVRAEDLGNILRVRGAPLTIGSFQHCGESLCGQHPGHWMFESTGGNKNVVAHRAWGSGWCSSNITIEQNDESTIGGCEYLRYMGEGYTYDDASTKKTPDQGLKSGNKDLRYPEYCGDVNYDLEIDLNDVLLLWRHVADPVSYPIHSDWDGDVNGDDSIDKKDVRLLFRHLCSPQNFSLSPLGWFIESKELADLAMEVSISADSIGAVPFEVSFSSSVESSDGNVSYDWYFDDGDSRSTLQNPTHTYNETGFYHISLGVTDSRGETEYDRIDIEVTEPDRWVKPYQAWSSSVHGNYAHYYPSLAIDGKNKTYWLSEENPDSQHWIWFNLANRWRVNCLRIRVTGTAVPENISIQTSDCSAIWKTVANCTITQGDAFVEVPIPYVHARYIRLVLAEGSPYGTFSEVDARVVR